MRPLVLDYLSDHSLGELEIEHGVKARPSKCFSKVSLNYDQLNVDDTNPLAKQCRGLIIRPGWDPSLVSADTYLYFEHSADKLDVVAWPLTRFFNEGDPAADEIDWKSATIYEKLDGTMCILYYDDVARRWFVATRSMPEADLEIMTNSVGMGHTFSSLFELAAEQTLLDCFGKHGGLKFLTSQLDEDHTYVFELTTPINRIVVRYDSYRITLLAVRNKKTGQEVRLDEMSGLGEHYLKFCPSWPQLNDVETLVEFVNNADPAKLEGAVAVDNRFRRLKVKNKAWVLSSKAKDLVTVSRRNAIKAIVNGSIDDVIPLVEKDIADELIRMRESLRQYLKSVDDNFKKLKETYRDDRKGFALAIKSSNDWETPYFSLLSGKAPNAFVWIEQLEENDRLSPSLIDQILKCITDPK